MMNRTGKVRQYRTAGTPGPELENHFILRLLEPQAKVLTEDIRQGQANIKDRLSIQLDYTQDKEDMRNGIITFDTLMYKARLVDLPSILESWKTIDGKNFYKTADVCQMLMVRETEDPPEEEDTKKKKRDPNKVDKKYLWPHGYTPPLKNVRKRRFRKTLRKKNLDLPDIEKEVKRLLRADNEAVQVRWEVAREEEEKKDGDPNMPGHSNYDKNTLFGEMSSSEDEIGTTINIIDEDEDSIEDSQYFMNESANSPSAKSLLAGTSSTPMVTEFSSSMFTSDDTKGSMHSYASERRSRGNSPSSRRLGKRLGTGQFQPTRKIEEANANHDTINKLYARLSHLETEMTQLLSQRAVQEAEIATIENMALKQKFLDKLAQIDSAIKEKDVEIQEVRKQIHE